MSFSLETELTRVIVGQKRTGKSKCFVLIYSDFVAKGPYSSERAQNTLTRSALLQQWKANFVIFPNSNFAADGSYYLLFPSFYKGYSLESEPHQESFSSYQYQILKNSPTVSLKEALGKDPSLWEKAKDLLYDLCLLNVLGVGDTGHRNIQVDLQTRKIYVIDFEENLGSDRDDEEFYFSKPSAKSLNWFNKVKEHYEEVADKLALLCQDAYISQFALTTRLERAISLLRRFSQRKQPGPLGHMSWNGMRGTSKTYSGVDFDVAKSALQKWIRRGEMEKALMIATELFRFSEIEGAGAAVTNLFNRLCIIAHEDVGPANLPLVLEVTDIVESGRRDYYELLAMVQLLTRSPKTRMMSHLFYVYVLLEHIWRSEMLPGYVGANHELWKQIPFDDIEQKDYPLPDYLDGEVLEEELIENLGMVEKRLKEKSYTAFTWAFLFTKSSTGVTLKKKVRKFSKGVNNTGKADIFIWRLLRKFLPDPVCDIFVKAYYNHVENRPILSCALLAVIKDKVAEKSEHVRELAMVWKSHPFSEKLLTGQYNLTVDDYVFDKHTKAGRSMGKGTKEFVMEGALVDKQDPELFDQKLHDLYVARKN